MGWDARLEEARRSRAERRKATPGSGERADLHLAGIASASWAEGLCLLMLGRRREAATALRRAAAEYAESESVAPPGSWGRPLASLRCRLLAAAVEGAAADARRILAVGAEEEASPIARYAAALALLALGEERRAAALAAGLRGRDDFPPPVADALHAIAERDEPAYRLAAAAVLRSFEERDAFLEDVPVADTVVVLERLAGPRGLRVELRSPLLPPDAAA